MNLRWPKTHDKMIVQMMRCSKSHEKITVREPSEPKALRSTPLEALKYAQLTWAGRSVKLKLPEYRIFSRAGRAVISDGQILTTK